MVTTQAYVRPFWGRRVRGGGGGGNRLKMNALLGPTFLQTIGVLAREIVTGV